MPLYQTTNWSNKTRILTNEDLIDEAFDQYDPTQEYPQWDLESPTVEGAMEVLTTTGFEKTIEEVSLMEESDWFYQSFIGQDYFTEEELDLVLGVFGDTYNSLEKLLDHRHGEAMEEYYLEHKI